MNFFAELKRRNVYKVAVAVRGCRLAARSSRDTSFPLLGNSERGRAPCDCTCCNRFSHRADRRLGF